MSADEWVDQLGREVDRLLERDPACPDVEALRRRADGGVR